MSHVYCQECGFQNPESSNYCSRCGALLVKDEAGTETTQTFTPDDGGGSPDAAREGPAGKRPAPLGRSGGGRGGGALTAQAGQTTIGRPPGCRVFLDDHDA